jgi:hypothetical protein
MAYEKLQGYLALEVYPSDNTDIPYTATVVKSAATSAATNKLIDTTVDFKANGTFAGDIVYNTTAKTSATVLSIDGANTLTLNADIISSSDKYTLYNASSVNNYQKANNGCVLYVGTSGDIKVDTISGTTVTFKTVPVGFFPVQVSKVYATGTTGAEIIALW